MVPVPSSSCLSQANESEAVKSVVNVQNHTQSRCMLESRELILVAIRIQGKEWGRERDVVWKGTL